MAERNLLLLDTFAAHAVSSMKAKDAESVAGLHVVLTAMTD